MSQRSKTSKFFIYAAAKSGYLKDRRLLGVNNLRKASTDDITLEDLLDFLKEKGVSPSQVKIDNGFITTAKAGP
jgi:hypothetical protein